MNEHAHPKLEKMAENTIARFFLQLITPILLGLLAWFGNRQLNSFEATQNRIVDKQSVQAEVTAKIASDVRDINTRFDVLAVRRLEELDKRVDRLESVTNTP